VTDLLRSLGHALQPWVAQHPGATIVIGLILFMCVLSTLETCVKAIFRRRK
jgi:hypothetical protein